jgi:DNA-binding NarL/FixJ family response regulator
MDVVRHASGTPRNRAPATTTTIVLIDDHELVRVGLRDYLGAFPEYAVIGDAPTAREAFPLIDQAKPDLVLMDLVMPGMDGVIATREVRRRAPRAQVIIVSAHRQAHDLIDAMEAGAAGYVLKSDDPATLIEAIETAVRGGRYVTRTLTPHVLATRGTRRPLAEVLSMLSEREHEVFRLAADCRAAGDIARDLCVARKTVESHLGRIHRKLGLRNQAELVRLAFSIGLVHSVRRCPDSCDR